MPMAEGRYIIGPEEVLKLCDENTIGVVAILGSTFTGQYEHVKEIAKALDGYQEETGNDIPLHVDGASGAMIAPFIQPELVWDSRLDRVISINTSGHRYGSGAAGRRLGGLARCRIPARRSHLQRELSERGHVRFRDQFLASGRSGLLLSTTNFLRLGLQGYTKIQQACQNVAMYLANGIGEMGPFEIIHDGSDIPVLSWRIAQGRHDQRPKPVRLERTHARAWLAGAVLYPAARAP